MVPPPITLIPPLVSLDHGWNVLQSQILSVVKLDPVHMPQLVRPRHFLLLRLFHTAFKLSCTFFPLMHTPSQGSWLSEDKGGI